MGWWQKLCLFKTKFLFAMDSLFHKNLIFHYYPFISMDVDKEELSEIMHFDFHILIKNDTRH